MQISYLTDAYFWGDNQNFPTKQVFDNITFLTDYTQCNANFTNNSSALFYFKGPEVPKYFKVVNKGIISYYKVDTIESYLKGDSDITVTLKCSVDIYTTFLLPNWNSFLNIDFEFCRSPYLTKLSFLANNDDMKDFESQSVDKIYGLDVNYSTKNRVNNKVCELWFRADNLNSYINIASNKYAVFAIDWTQNLEVKKAIPSSSDSAYNWENLGQKVGENNIVGSYVFIPIVPKSFNDSVKYVEKNADGSNDLHGYSTNVNNGFNEIYKELIRDEQQGQWSGKFQGIFEGPPFMFRKCDVIINYHNKKFVGYLMEAIGSMEFKNIYLPKLCGDYNIETLFKLPRPYTSELRNVYAINSVKIKLGESNLNLGYLYFLNYIANQKRPTNQKTNNGSYSLEVAFANQFVGYLTNNWEYISYETDRNNLGDTFYRSYDVKLEVNKLGVIKYNQNLPSINNSYSDWVRSNQNTWDTGYNSNIGSSVLNSLVGIAQIGLGTISWPFTMATSAIGATQTINSIAGGAIQGEMMKAKKRDAQNTTTKVQPTPVENLTNFLKLGIINSSSFDNQNWLIYEYTGYETDIIKMINNQVYYKNYYGYVVGKIEDTSKPYTDLNNECGYYEMCGESLVTNLLKFVAETNTTYIPNHEIYDFLFNLCSSGFRLWRARIVGGTYINGRQRATTNKIFQS